MNRRADSAARAYREALRFRSRANRPTNVPVCPFDLAEEIGIEVRFADIASLEAVYVDDGAPKILIAADRPPGRQRFSCAHELGHHAFGHGTHLSCIDFTRAGDLRIITEDEMMAQMFASFLLLPKAAVNYAFAVRGWDLRQGVPEQFFVVAGVLGVGFDALVTHCQVGLRLLAKPKAEALHAVKLPQLRERIAGQAIAGSLTVMDAYALDVAVDLCVGDHLLVPPAATPANDALVAAAVTSTRTLLRAHRPGLSGVRVPSEAAISVVRISRAGYVGRAVFRHLEDPDYD